MREIKFRAWQKEIGITYMEDFQYGELIDYITHPGKDVILMQYTGLKDKNGKEIYEGDIVKIPYYGKLYPPKIEEVKCDKYSFFPFSWYLQSEDGYSKEDETEVIGNIYENPELLEKK